MKSPFRCRLLVLGILLLALAVLALPAAALAATLTVPAGQTVVVDETTKLTALTVETGGILAAPDGHSLNDLRGRHESPRRHLRRQGRPHGR